MTSNGIILVDKPEGITSNKAIQKIKRSLGLKKIGHAGTLDPFATGLLVCATNSATKVLQFAQSGIKEYSGTILFGTRTDTDDVTGSILEEVNISIEQETLNKLKQNFIGEIDQIPPQYSAIKIGGKKAYELARKGEVAPVKSRKTTIYSFDIEKTEEKKAVFKIRCSKGTYIRSIARDFGDLYNTGACLETLRRHVSEPFSVDDAKKLDDVVHDCIIPWERLFPNMEIHATSDELASLVHGGNQEAFRKLISDVGSNEPFLYRKVSSDRALGMIVRKADEFKIGFNINLD